LRHQNASVVDYLPEMPAPTGGIYEQYNVLGSPTGEQVSVVRGEPLPRAPRGFTWRVVEVHREP
jgi:hypothetical protein